MSETKFHKMEIILYLRPKYDLKKDIILGTYWVILKSLRYMTLKSQKIRKIKTKELCKKMTENFSNWVKDSNLQIQKTQPHAGKFKENQS